jgi:hypothetical protein
MQFESTIKRRLWTSALLNTVPDLAISAVAAYAIDGGVFAFVIVLVGLQIVYFLVWLRTAIWSWIVFWAGGRKRLADLYLDGLRRCRYPAPEDYSHSRGITDAGDYFSLIVNDEQQPFEIRMNATSDLNFRTTLRSLSLFRQAMQHELAIEDALERYQWSLRP